MRIFLWGDGLWAARTLERIHSDGHEVLAVVLRRRESDSALPDMAQSLNLPTYRPRNCNDPSFVETVRKLRADVHLSLSYDQIIKRPLRETATWGFLNVHTGKLPHYRGRSVVNWAIINGESEIGLTLHFMDDGIDTGDIVAQTTLPIKWTDTYAEVMDRLIRTIPRAVSKVLERIDTGKFERRAQSHLLGSYFPKRRPGDEWLDFTQPSARVYNMIRGLGDPGPGARTLLGGKTLIVWRAEYDPNWPSYLATPGEVVAMKSNGIRVKTGDSTIVITRVEIEGDTGGPHCPHLRIGTRIGPDPAAALEALRALQLARKDELR